MSNAAASSSSSLLKLHVIIASTRPGRVGLPVGQWFVDHAKKHGKFDVTLVDLAEINLPFLNEPKHPSLQQYQHEHTKQWSRLIDAADAYVAVTPEYNFSTPAPLINALDYLYKEWLYKPIGAVSYGGISGGLRSVQHAKHQFTALKMMPIPEQVTIPFVSKFVQDDGKTFKAENTHEQSATTMLDELHRWATALKTMRANKS